MNMEGFMHKIKVYDLPTRAFHFIFGALFISSFGIGKLIDDDSSLYAYHMLSGILMLFIVLLRVIWGWIGTEYAKFKSFCLSPKSLLIYFQNLISSKTERSLGHNPASSFAAIFMFLLSFLMVITGLLMISGLGKEFFEEVHELFAHSFLLLVIFHIAGVLYHQFKHKDGIVFSIFTGEKNWEKSDGGISHQAPFAFILFLIFTIGFSGFLLKNFDYRTSSLKVFGFDLKLKEIENDHPEKDYRHSGKERELDEEDD